MFDIGNKEELIQTIINEVGYCNITLNTSSMTSIENIKDQIEYAIDIQTNSIIRSIINHLYTNKEFEQDLGIS